MKPSFSIVVETAQGREVHPAADLEEAIHIFRNLLDKYPKEQLHLVRDVKPTKQQEQWKQENSPSQASWEPSCLPSS